MRVEVVSASREMFGSDRSAVRLAELLEQIGHEARLAVPAARAELGLGRLAADRGLRVEPAPVVIASSRGLEGIARSLASRARSDAELTIYNSSAVVARRGDRRPRVLILREWLNPAWRPHRALSALHARRVDAVVAVSNGVAERWRACVGGSAVPVQVCPNWLEQGWLEDYARVDREGVLFVGRLNAWKGHWALVEAFEQAFASPRPQPSLTFLGAEAASSPFHREATRLAARCRRAGWRLLPFSSTPGEAMRRAALVVVPSQRPEPFGNVIVEALASGARVLAFPGGGVDDLAPLFGGALEVVERDPRALSAALARWSDEGSAAQASAERERVLATLRARFTAEAAAPCWREVLERVSRAG